MTSSLHIVDFLNPPVAEVALAVQLQGPTLDTSRILNVFWPTIADQYPLIEPQPLLPPMEENFEIPSQPTIGFLIGGPEAQRWFMVSADERELIQVQPDRFGYNWRKEQSKAAYPRYEHVRTRFTESFQSYLSALGKRSEETGAAWCEISYVNPLFGPVGSPRSDLSRLLTRVVPQNLSVLPAPFNSSLSEQFQLERDGSPYARFYIETASTVQRLEQRLGYTITLTMRGKPASSDIDGILSFFDDGRERIVKTFRDITIPERHREWGLQP